ncbi:MAG: bifunctional demethylmenaquinone methyltransferase/2-methoxy-6-polyprenyl-1,4-benzoquinol methylase UbiE [Acidobacteria bacterium]|nr:MAG: bifunctional demethylmenaquinone methyltransferase/2-methoxy-6-polyprenyl-1,4-benzoquinol methylase UbiE [Acidobacteriota bacterium]
MKDVAAPAKGTQPEGAVSEADASKKIREMFTQIAPRYDLLNHLLSFELDRLWRARAAKRLRPILERPDALVLDLCCGTGDLALALSHAGKARILGADFAHTMLVRAIAKSSAQFAPNSSNPATPMSFFEADALRLPFAHASFDLVTSAFGFRNLANYEAGLREIYRVLKPGGTIAIMEFAEPPQGLLGDLYRWYFTSVLPRVGWLISGHQSAYTYLPKSVARFFRPPELAALLRSVGFQSVEFFEWTMRTVALHTARRPLT